MNQNPQNRLLIAWAGLLLFFGALYFASGTAWGARLLALIPIFFAWGSFRHFARQFPTIRRRLFRRVVRFIRHWRAYSTCSATLRSLYHLSFGFVLVGMAFILCGMKPVADIVMVCAIAVIAIAGCMDMVAKLSRILRAAWAPALGKFLSVSLGVALAAAALSLAKETAHTLAHIDPKYLPEFTNVLTIGMLPIVYGAALMAILGMYSLFQLTVLVGFMLLSMPMQAVTPYVTSSYRMKVRVVWYRLQTGKQPPGRVLPESGLAAIDDLTHFAKPIGTLAVVMLLSYLLQSVIAVMPVARPALTKALVWLEYRDTSACTNLPRTALVAYMEGSYVSVAVPDAGGFRFDVRQCELGKTSATPGS